MKSLIIVAAVLLFPLSAFAGGSHHYEKQTPPIVVQPNEVVWFHSINDAPPSPWASEVPQPPVKQSSGGNGEIYCSSPTAPGWRVDLPNGGCEKQVTKVPLSVLPYTGDNSLWDRVLSAAILALVFTSMWFGFGYFLKK